MTDFKKEIENLLDSLKELGYERGAIEEKLGYSENAIDQSLARKGTKKLYSAIKMYKEYVLLKAITEKKNLKGYGQPVNFEDAGVDLSKVLEQIEIDLKGLTDAAKKISGTVTAAQRAILDSANKKTGTDIANGKRKPRMGD